MEDALPETTASAGEGAEPGVPAEAVENPNDQQIPDVETFPRE
jgi:hypothetical protein